MFDCHVLNRLIAWKCVLSDASGFAIVANSAVHRSLPVILAEDLHEVSSFEFSHLLDEVIEEVGSESEPVYRREKDYLEFYRELLKLAVIMRCESGLYILHILDWTLYLDLSHEFVRTALDRGKENLCCLLDDKEKVHLIIFDLYESSGKEKPETLIDSMVEYFEKEAGRC